MEQESEFCPECWTNLKQLEEAREEIALLEKQLKNLLATAKGIIHLLTLP